MTLRSIEPICHSSAMAPESTPDRTRKLRVRVEHDVSEQEKAQFNRASIGEEVSETLEYTPAKLVVLQHARLKYRCEDDQGGSTVRTASAVTRRCPAAMRGRACWRTCWWPSTSITIRWRARSVALRDWVPMPADGTWKWSRPPALREDVVFPNAAAIDVGASSHWAAVPPHTTDAPVREFGAMTDDLNVLADWLLACGVDVVALESTGVYWIPVYEVLEQRGLKVWLVDARQVKYVPGRKSDVQDCQWLQKLMSHGLLRAAFRPAADVCVIRAVARQREVLLTEQASWVQRMQKALVQMNIQLTEVISDVMGQTGQAIIRDIIAGERDAKTLARHRHRRVKASEGEIVRALTGNWREEHLFVLKQALAMYDDIAVHLRECDAKLQALLAERSAANVDIGKTPRAGSKARSDYDVRQQLANWAGADLTRINGLGLDSVMKILSEIGADLSRFANVKHFCSWLGLAPATKISGGKVICARTKRSANRVRQALKMAAMSLSHSDSALGAFYRRLCSRMDKPRANTATAHKLARMVYFMLTRGEAYVDQGQQRYEEQQRQRSIAALRRRAADLGFAITPTASPA